VPKSNAEELMNFLYPNFLYGLFALIFPILVHLFNFQRYKIVYFSNFQFLQNLQLQTKRHSNVKRWILLLLRLLVILFVVLIFAHPYRSDSTQTKKFASNTVCVFIDNSFSMSAKGDDNLLINEAKETARKIAMSYSPSDKFVLLTNDLSAAQFRTISRDDFLENIDNISVSGASKQFSEIFSQISDLFSTLHQTNKKAYIISDFQISAFNVSEFSNDTSILVSLMQLPHANNNNLAIDSCWFEEPIFRKDQNLSIFVQIHNYGNQPLENIPVSLKINDKSKASAIFNIAANSTAVVPLNFSCNEVGPMNGALFVNDPGETSFDDSYFLSFSIQSSINVLEIEDKSKNQFVKSVYQTDSIFHYSNQNLNSLKYNELSNYQLIILSQPSQLASGTILELMKYVKNGGSLAITMPASSQLDPSIPQFLQQECNISIGLMDTASSQIQFVNVLHPLYKHVFDGSILGASLPQVNRHFAVSNKTGAFQELFRLQNSDCVFGSVPIEQGTVYVFGIAPDDFFGDFNRHPLIVPTFMNMAFAHYQFQKISNVIHNNEVIRLRNVDLKGDQVLKMKNAKQNIEIVPQIVPTNGEIHLYEQNQISEPGIYQIYNGEEIVHSVAFNYNNLESNMNFLNNDKLKELTSQKQLSNFSIQNSNLASINSSIVQNSFFSISNWLVIFTLLMLFIEILIVKFWQ